MKKKTVLILALIGIIGLVGMVFLVSRKQSGPESIPSREAEPASGQEVVESPAPEAREKPEGVDAGPGDLIKDFPLEETIPPKMAAMVAILEGNLGEAAELLSPISATDSAALLMESFNNPDSSAKVRDNLVKAGMIIGAPEMKELFRAGLRDPDAPVRASSVRAWVATGLSDDGLTDEIKALLSQDSSENVRSAAATYFYQRPEECEAAAAELQQALNDPAGWTAWKAAFALTSAEVSAPGLKEAMSDVYRKYGDSTIPNQRSAAAAAAAYLALMDGGNEYRDAVLRFLEDEDRDVRSGAVLGTAAFPDDGQVMSALVNAIWKQPGSRSLFDALARVARKDKSPELLEACSDSVASMPTEPSRALTRLSGAAALAALGNEKEGFSIIYSLMNHPDLNCVFKRVACTKLRRASKMDLPYDPFDPEVGRAEWEGYLDSLSD